MSGDDRVDAQEDEILDGGLQPRQGTHWCHRNPKVSSPLVELPEKLGASEEGKDFHGSSSTDDQPCTSPHSPILVEALVLGTRGCQFESDWGYVTEKPTAFHDLPADSFPFTMEVFGKDGVLLWSCEVCGPGAVAIPGFQGAVAYVRTTFANGQVEVVEPPP